MSFTTSLPEVDSCQEDDSSSSFLLEDDMLFPFIVIDFSLKHIVDICLDC